MGESKKQFKKCRTRIHNWWWHQKNKRFHWKIDIIFKVSESNPKEAKMKVSIDVSSINTAKKVRD